MIAAGLLALSFLGMLAAHRASDRARPALVILALTFWLFALSTLVGESIK